MGGFNSKLTQPHAFGRKAIKLSVNTAASAQTTPPPDGVTPFSRVFFVVLLLHVVLRCRVTRVSGGVHALIVTNARVPWICRYGAIARVQLSLSLSFFLFLLPTIEAISSRKNITLVKGLVIAQECVVPLSLPRDLIRFNFFYYAYKLRPLDSNRYDHLFLPLLADLSRTCARHNLRGNLGMGIFPVEVDVRSD